jgi:hypothetical protein
MAEKLYKRRQEGLRRRGKGEEAISSAFSFFYPQKDYCSKI